MLGTDVLPALEVNDLATIIDGRDIEDIEDAALEALHWKCFGIWMEMRHKARRKRLSWAAVWSYAREVLDPIMYALEERGVHPTYEEGA